MVKFNNKPIDIYELDSVESIIKRLSALENTLPKYICLEETIDIEKLIKTDVNIKFINAVDIFTNQNKIEDVYDKLKPYFTFRQIVTNFILFNKNFSDILDTVKTKEYRGAIFLKLKSELEKINSEEDDISIENIFNSRYEDDLNYNEEVEKNKAQVEKIIKAYKKFEDISGSKYTEFELEKIKFQIELDNNMSILELFNDIKLNKNIPFATTKYFYKIFKDIIPDKKWFNLFDKSTTNFDKYKNIDRDNNIIIKISDILDTDLSENFTEAIINITQDKTKTIPKNITIIQMNYEIKNSEITQDNLINSILKIINIDTYKNKKDINVNGFYDIPAQKLNKYIMADIIMNDALFSNLLTIDESKIKKKKRSTIYIHFKNPMIENLTAFITPQKGKNKNGSDNFYLRVKINYCESKEKVRYFQNILSKLLVLYNQKYEMMVKQYNNYGIYFPEKEDDYVEEDTFNENKLRKLREIEPEIFRSSYTRICRNLLIPMTDEEAKIEQENGVEVITFPKELKNGIMPKKYKCEKGMFPGLRENPYNNKGQFPYIPCCYKRNQKITKNSKYIKYYNEENIEDTIDIKKQKKDNIYISKTIIPDSTFGTLPTNIDRCFFLPDNFVFYREGSTRNSNSFLSCIMKALDIKKFSSIKNEAERNKLLNETRLSLNKPKFIASCKQEMYGYTDEDIVNIIIDNTKYFDPKLFIHLIELKYNCNIFIFNTDDNGELTIPRHTHGYYKTIEKKQCIFIFENNWVKDKNYPQCELIVTIDEEETPIRSFDYNSEISKNIFEVFVSINNSYIFNKKIELINFSLKNENVKILSQFIDAYGKTRIINIKYNNNDISVITTPIQPILIAQDIEIKINKTDIKTVIDFIKTLDGNIIKQIVDENDFVKEIHAVIEDIDIIIPIVDNSPKLNDIEWLKISNENINDNGISTLSYPENNISTINNFNKYKKLSRYILEYLIWLYSKYVDDNSIDENDILLPDNLKNFKDERIEIIENFEYSNISKQFSLNDSGIIQDEKIIIKSEETLKRIFYSLFLYIRRNFNKFMEYKDRQTIENFYVDITDFDVYNFQVILEGENSIIKWINEKNNQDNVLYENINMSYAPYFFRHESIKNGRIFLAQNVDSFIKAMNVSIIWKNNGYNPGNNIDNNLDNNINIDTENILESTLYTKLTNKTVEKITVIGKKNNFNIRIIGYKIENVSLYTVLLEV